MIKNSFYFGSIAVAVLASGAVAAQEVNLYTTREPGLIQPLLDAFTEETGIEVNSIFVSDGLEERVAAEGQLSPADVLMTVDFGRLIDLVEQGLTQSTDSAVLNSVVPANLRGDNGHWYALSMRARMFSIETPVQWVFRQMTLVWTEITRTAFHVLYQKSLRPSIATFEKKLCSNFQIKHFIFFARKRKDGLKFSGWFEMFKIKNFDSNLG